MISKVIGCADIHIKNIEGLDELKESLKYFLEDVKKISDEEKKDGNEIRVVVAGDIFDQKINITNEAQMTAYWFFNELNSLCKTYVVAGNHDYIVDNTDRLDSLTPIFMMAKWKNVVYLDSKLGYDSGTIVDNNIVWHLFSSFSGFSTTYAEAMRVKYPDKTHIGIIHADINGATTYLNYITDRGLDPGIFKGLDFVIAGHIHKRQELQKNGVKIVYCSSITQKNFGEGITGHGYVLWSIGEECTYEYVDLPVVKGYYQFNADSVECIENDNEKLMNL